MSSLHTLAYNAVLNHFGTPACDITVGRKYKLLKSDGSFIDLGKCLENNFSCGNFSNDFMHIRTLRFEKNNDNNLLEKKLYHNTHKKINVFEKLNNSY